MTELDLLKHNALRNALYHTGRRRALERANRFFTFLVIVLGASAVSDVLGSVPFGRVGAGLAIAIVGSLQLVLDFAGRASTHAVLQKQFYSVLADMQETIDPGPEALVRFEAALIRIYADEPPVLRALDAKAYNDAIDALGAYATGERLVIPWWHRLLGSVFSFEGHNYVKLSELPAPKTG